MIKVTSVKMTKRLKTLVLNLINLKSSMEKTLDEKFKTGITKR